MHAPLKKKLLRTNHSQYVTKALRKAIMRRSKLEKIYFKKQTNESLKAYKKQKNHCSKLYKKERKKFFDNLNTSVVSDNKTEIAEELNLFSSNAVKSLNIAEDTYIRNRVSDNLKDPVTRAIKSLKLIQVP